jgi:hypothetical protein
VCFDSYAAAAAAAVAAVRALRCHLLLPLLLDPASSGLVRFFFSFRLLFFVVRACCCVAWVLAV